MEAKVFILAAGLGTRLKPITETMPKAMVACNGKPLLEHAVQNLKSQGFKHFVINVHHFADQIEAFLKEKNDFNCEIQISDEREQLLDTGGALLHAKHLLEDSENIIIYNVDILSDINLTKLLNTHISGKATATLALDLRESSRKLLFNKKMQLCRWKNNITGEEKIALKSETNLSEYAFTGIHIINKKLLSLITEAGKFSVIDLYLRLAEKYKILGYRALYKYWFDLGKPETLRKAESFLKEMQP